LPLVSVRGAMTNLTALLLVLTLNGVPVSRVVCVTECQQEPAASDNRHREVAASEGPMVSAGSDCSDPSVSESPYLVEDRPLRGSAVLTTTSSLMAAALVRTDVAAELAGRAVAWLKPTLVLRL
jgi:hypothetical protein